jgi:hypothetical protein
MKTKLFGAVGLATLGVALCANTAPVAADAFYVGFSNSSPHWRPHHHHPRQFHRARIWGPPVVFYAPPTVVYRLAPIVAPVTVALPPRGAPLSVTPAGQPYRTADGLYCREYTATVGIAGAAQPSYGTACLMPDGAWRIVN